MRFRKLRIVWSAGCTIACVLLLVLWVRSYWRSDEIDATYAWGISQHGQILLFLYPTPAAPIPWQFDTMSITPDIGSFGASGFEIDSRGVVLIASYWYLPMACAMIAAAPWLPWWSRRFSLRTLLIATTLVSLILGAIVYASK